MFTRSLAFTAALLVSVAANAAETPNLGTPITEAEAKAWDLSILPNGEGLPPGRGSVQQGELIYEQNARAATPRRAPARQPTNSSAGRAR